MVVVGAGLIGLAAAAAVAGRGSNVLLLGRSRQGEASPAGAGILSPTVERSTGAAHAFAVAARDRYPSYVAWLAERTGVAVPVNRLGVLVVAVDEGERERLFHGLTAGGARPLDPGELAELELALAHASGAMLCPRDGAVDNQLLLVALRRLVEGDRRIAQVAEAAVSVEPSGDGVAVVTESGARHEAPYTVLAAGAWAPQVAGLPRPLRVEPVRGQMLSFAASPLRHVAYGSAGYLVPRDDGRTLAGATMERVAFDARTTDEGLAAVRGAAVALCPALAGAPVIEGWAGLRPVTPDLLPIIGPDPKLPGLIYACGHSRNGILMAPLTGDCVATLVTGGTPELDLEPFRVDRF